MDLRRQSCLWIDPTRAGFARPADWQAWSIARFDRFAQPPAWLIDLASAADSDAMQAAILGSSLPPWDSSVRVLGYVFARHLAGDLAFEDAVRTCAELADAYDTNLSVEDIVFMRRESTDALTARLTRESALSLLEWVELHRS